MTLGKLLKFSGLLFPHLQAGKDSSTHLTGGLGWLKERMVQGNSQDRERSSVETYLLSARGGMSR